MLMRTNTAQLIVVDVQARLLPAMHAPEQVTAHAGTLIRAARAMGVPILITEQYPRGLGHTEPRLLDACGPDASVLAKMTFSAMQDEGCSAHVGRIAHEQGRRQIVLCGLESHVCVLQSALDFATAGFEVFVAADAVSSRAPASVDIALRRMERAGVSLVTTEMVLFEWLERAGTDAFRTLSKLVR